MPQAVEKPTPDQALHRLAEEFYGIYGDAGGWKTGDGKPMPPWIEIGGETQAKWIAVARFAITMLTPSITLDANEYGLVTLSHEIASDYADVHVMGANMYRVIAKLAACVNVSLKR